MNKILFKKISTDTITPVLSLLKVAKKFPDYHFLLESAEKRSAKGRFSVIGFMPDAVWKCVDGKAFINKNFEKNRTDFVEQTENPIQNLRKFINESQIDWSNLDYDVELAPSVCAGIFGYMSYDMSKLMENLPNKNLPDEANIPDSIFIRPQIVIVFDNLFDIALICAPIFDEKNTKKTQENIELTQDILLSPLEEKLSAIACDVSNINSAQTSTQNNIALNFSSTHNEDEYCKMVETAKDYIKSGDIFQVLCSQQFTANFDKNLSEFSFYRALRSINPSPFLFYLKFEDFVLSGSSPEIMASVKNRKMTVRPLAGTRKIGKTKEENKKIAEELLNNEKEVAEHLMLIDLARHDVGRVAKNGSVKLTEKMVIENYSAVMHISSNVEGILRDEVDCLDALISAFPAGTVSGAPKIRAMEIIEELEKTKRGFYSGCVGYFAANGDMESCITLRSALIKNHKLYLQSGAGIVFDSDPKSEYQECLSKANALMKAMEMVKNKN